MFLGCGRKPVQARGECANSNTLKSPSLLAGSNPEHSCFEPTMLTDTALLCHHTQKHHKSNCILHCKRNAFHEQGHKFGIQEALDSRYELPETFSLTARHRWWNSSFKLSHSSLLLLICLLVTHLNHLWALLFTLWTKTGIFRANASIWLNFLKTLKAKLLPQEWLKHSLGGGWIKPDKYVSQLIAGQTQ